MEENQLSNKARTLASKAIPPLQAASKAIQKGYEYAKNATGSAIEKAHLAEFAERAGKGIENTFAASKEAGIRLRKFQKGFGKLAKEFVHPSDDITPITTAKDETPEQRRLREQLELELAVEMSLRDLEAENAREQAAQEEAAEYRLPAKESKSDHAVAEPNFTLDEQD